MKKNDWRLQGQEKYLKGVVLHFCQYKQSRENWDHDHCEFCGEKFAESQVQDETIHKEGYTNENFYYWVCSQCFHDFKDTFKWRVEELKN